MRKIGKECWDEAEKQWGEVQYREAKKIFFSPNFTTWRGLKRIHQKRIRVGTELAKINSCQCSKDIAIQLSSVSAIFEEIFVRGHPTPVIEWVGDKNKKPPKALIRTYWR